MGKEHGNGGVNTLFRLGADKNLWGRETLGRVGLQQLPLLGMNANVNDVRTAPLGDYLRKKRVRRLALGLTNEETDRMELDKD